MLVASARYLSAASHSQIAPWSLRKMANQPSLKSAEDFLSFVNASPTRKTRGTPAAK
jgi:hypothetical protein